MPLLRAVKYSAHVPDSQLIRISIDLRLKAELGLLLGPHAGNPALRKPQKLLDYLLYLRH